MAEDLKSLPFITFCWCLAGWFWFLKGKSALSMCLLSTQAQQQGSQISNTGSPNIYARREPAKRKFRKFLKILGTNNTLNSVVLVFWNKFYILHSVYIIIYSQVHILKNNLHRIYLTQVVFKYSLKYTSKDILIFSALQKYFENRKATVSKSKFNLSLVC